LIGDDRQLSSIERGGMFAVLKERYGAAELTEVRRQQAHDDRQASALMAKGNFRDALSAYDEKGAIHWTGTQAEGRAALVERWAKDNAADASKSRFVFAYTNQDANELNAAIRDVRQQRRELGDGREFETKHGVAEFATGDRLQFTATDKQRGIYNGQAGTVQGIEGTTLTVALDGKAGRVVRFDGAEFDGFRHGYAGTIYKGQGRTFDQTYLYHSEHWRASASYVALTRHREKAEIFVARDIAGNLGELSQQIARVDERRAATHFQHSAARNVHQAREEITTRREPPPSGLCATPDQATEPQTAEAAREATERRVTATEATVPKPTQQAQNLDEPAAKIRRAYRSAVNAADLTGTVDHREPDGTETQQQINLEIRQLIELSRAEAARRPEIIKQEHGDVGIDWKRFLADPSYRRELAQRRREEFDLERVQGDSQIRGRVPDR
jgi:hypothetical protein